MGIALCPERVLARDFAQENLVRLEWAAAPAETMIMMITHEDKWCSPPLEHFMALAEQAVMFG